MADYFWTWSNVSISEQFNRRSYILNKNSQLGWDVFRVLQEENQSYYTFRRSCEVAEIVRRMLSNCFTIEIDNRSIAVVHDGEFHRTGNLEVVIPQNSSDPHSNFTIVLATQFNMKRFMFSIFVIEQNMKRLVAQVNAVSSASSKLPIPDAYTFTVNIIEETNEKEIELVIILCLMIDEMRGYTGDDDDDKEDFYDNN
jgi:hypothetical protein